jgi:hypothetical protein
VADSGTEGWKGLALVIPPMGGKSTNLCNNTNGMIGDADDIMNLYSEDCNWSRSPIAHQKETFQKAFDAGCRLVTAHRPDQVPAGVTSIAVLREGLRATRISSEDTWRKKASVDCERLIIGCNMPIFAVAGDLHVWWKAVQQDLLGVSGDVYPSTVLKCGSSGTASWHYFPRARGFCRCGANHSTGKVRVIVQNLLSPNYCADGVKESISMSGITCLPDYHKRGSGDFVSSPVLEAEGKIVVDWMKRNTEIGITTVFILQEVWPIIRKQAEDAGFKAPEDLKGKWGTCAIFIDPYGVAVESISSIDLNEHMKSEFPNKKYSGTNNPCLATISCCGSRITFLSCHLPFDVCIRDEYIKWIIKNNSDVVAWDASNYGVNRLESLKKVMSATAAAANMAQQSWETALFSSVNYNPIRTSYSAYIRSDHNESVQGELTFKIY